MIGEQLTYIKFAFKRQRKGTHIIKTSVRSIRFGNTISHSERENQQNKSNRGLLARTRGKFKPRFKAADGNEKSAHIRLFSLKNCPKLTAETTDALAVLVIYLWR